MSHDIGSSVCARHPIHVSCAWVIVCSLFDPHFTLFICLSHLPLHPPELWLLPFPLPCGSRRGKIPCALRPMRSLALWPITPLSQVMSPTSSTISTTRRPLKFSFRSNPATRGPRTCMTRRSVTIPSSAERSLSLHHCSLRSEKNQPPVDKAYHSLEESLLPSQSLSVCHVRTARPVLAGKSNPLFVPMKTPTPSTERSCTRRFVAQRPRTSGKAVTTKSCG